MTAIVSLIIGIGVGYLLNSKAPIKHNEVNAYLEAVSYIKENHLKRPDKARFVGMDSDTVKKGEGGIYIVYSSCHANNETGEAFIVHWGVLVKYNWAGNAHCTIMYLRAL